MRELIELIKFKTNNDEGDWEHYSSYCTNYVNDRKEVSIYVCEIVDGCVENYLLTPNEYFEKLSSNPLILSEISYSEIKSLKELVGDNTQIVHCDTDYSLRTAKIAYYCFYNFRKIEVELDVITMNIKVFDITKGFLSKEDFEMPFEDYMSAAALVRELFAEEDFDLQKCHCIKCNHTYYVQGRFDSNFDRCIYCNSSENVIIEDYSVPNVG